MGTIPRSSIQGPPSGPNSSNVLSQGPGRHPHLAAKTEGCNVRAGCDRVKSELAGIGYRRHRASCRPPIHESPNVPAAGQARASVHDSQSGFLAEQTLRPCQINACDRYVQLFRATVSIRSRSILTACSSTSERVASRAYLRECRRRRRRFSQTPFRVQRSLFCARRPVALATHPSCRAPCRRTAR